MNALIVTIAVGIAGLATEVPRENSDIVDCYYIHVVTGAIYQVPAHKILGCNYHLPINPDGTLINNLKREKLE